MGLGPATISLYEHLARNGSFDGIHKVVELGAQNIGCAGHEEGVARLYEACGKTPPHLRQLAENQG